VAAARKSMLHPPSARIMPLIDYADLAPDSPNQVLIHVAEPRDIAAAETDATVHTAGVRRVLMALLSKRWGHVVYASSAAVYGDGVSRPRRTDEPVIPVNAYARAKAICEAEVLAAGGAVARLANLYGPGMAANNVISDILRQIPGTGPLTVRDGAPVRDYLWVDDAARGIADLASTRAGGVVNFGTGRGLSVGEVARIALDLAGQSERQVVASAPTVTPSHLILDVSATVAMLGWRSKVSLEEGLKALLAMAA
jgi:nucleoside-diphosphate-sugar epimerase